ncbi:hypothetical protein V6N13_127171 [Hibiscus sabdariffa]
MPEPSISTQLTPELNSPHHHFALGLNLVQRSDPPRPHPFYISFRRLARAPLFVGSHVLKTLAAANSPLPLMWTSGSGRASLDRYSNI